MDTNKLNNKIQELLTEYDHENSESGVRIIIDEWLWNKASLIEKLSKHPNWDSENFRIVFNQDYNRPIDKTGIWDFSQWVTKKGKELPQEDRENLYAFTTYLNNISGNIIMDEFAENFKMIYPDIPCTPGTRIMKVVRKVLMKYGLDKIVDIQTTRWTDDNGIEHSREKDMGSNYQIAHLGDSINPLTITRHTIISVNPLDYLTMSFGNGWASCHTIDKKNKRGNRNTYEGQYCSGTLSYMLDCSSVIFYTVSSDYDGNAYEEEDKINRVMFHFNEDYSAMIEGRVYPDGRDGGDEGLAVQFRQVMQKVISDCTKENNLWTLKKGTSEISDYVQSEGTHYRDYRHYEDCTISIRKGTENPKMIYVGHRPICPSCGDRHDREDQLCCYACKEDHEGDTCCEYCGDWFDDEDQGVYCEDNGCYYCCENCAENDDVHYCEDDWEWHTESNCYYDSYDGNWYHECEVHTEDGHHYRNSDNAEADGYTYDQYGDWYPEDEVHYDENRDVYFHEDDSSVYIDGNWYEDADSAMEDGYIDFDGEWYKEEDCVTDALTGEIFPNDFKYIVEIEKDGCTVYYMTEENAEADGWIKNENGEWVVNKEDAA